MSSMFPKSQADLVDNFLEEQETGKEVTDQVRVGQLLTKSREEIAEVLVNVLKSRADIRRLEWDVSKDYVEVTYVAR